MIFSRVVGGLDMMPFGIEWEKIRRKISKNVKNTGSNFTLKEKKTKLILLLGYLKENTTTKDNINNILHIYHIFLVTAIHNFILCFVVYNVLINKAVRHFFLKKVKEIY